MKLGPSIKSALKVSLVFLIAFGFLYCFGNYESKESESNPPLIKKEDTSTPIDTVNGVDSSYTELTDNLYIVSTDSKVFDEFNYIPLTLGVDSDERLLF